MTDKEAIYFLDDIKTDAIYKITSGEKEAIELAISALCEHMERMEREDGCECCKNSNPFDGKRVMVGQKGLWPIKCCPICGRKLSGADTNVPAKADHMERSNEQECVESALTKYWISVEDRLPNNDGYDWVLAQIVDNDGFMWIPRVCEYRPKIDDWFCEPIGWFNNHKDTFHVTHWMPLPEPPKTS